MAALVAALVGAIGPADTVRTTFSWPGSVQPSATEPEEWFSPLLLIRHEPEQLTADFPCSHAQLPATAGRPRDVLATARNPAQAGGLAVTPRGDRLVVSVGEVVLTEAALAARETPPCRYRLRLGDGRWSLEGGPAGDRSEGELAAMPVVTGLFATSTPGAETPTIAVTTAVHAARPTAQQQVAWVFAALAALAALVLATLERRPRGALGAAHGAAGAAVRHVHLVDVVVVSVLVGWVVLSPVFWDDGWVVVRERTYAESEGFSTFYSVLGVNLPLDYWVEWLQHWITQSTTALPLMRLPSLACLVSIWVLVRWALDRVARPPAGRGDAASWALATSFLAGALAWGMTLRPEPVTGLLVAGVLVCAVRFRERESATPVAVAAVLVPLALTAHHTGVLALAPAIAVAPQLLRWARSRVAAFVTIVTASVALFVTLVFVGSDLTQRLADARTTRESGITQAWRDELSRYVLLGEFPFGSPLRRGSVALIALAVLAYVVRRRTSARPLLDLPAVTLVVSLFLLVLTPSKLPWHFGALVGPIALAVAAETVRLREDGRRFPGSLRSLVALGAAVFAAAWVWGPREPWNPVDLRTLGWLPGLDALLPFSSTAVLLPVLLVVGGLFVEALRGRRAPVARVAARVACWTAAVLTVPLILFTIGVLAADLVKTSSWTLTRQNLDALVGRHDCGLAEDVLVPDPESIRALPLVRQGALPVPPAWIAPAPVASLPRFQVRPAGSSRSGPWFALSPTTRLGAYVAGAPDRLALQWGRVRQGRVEPGATTPITVARQSIETHPWRFVAASELPLRDPEATAVRFVLTGDGAPGAPVVVSAPVTYENEVLARQLERGSTLVHPNLLLYFPCAEQPVLDDGVVDVPRHIVWFDHPFQPHPYEPSSTFLGLSDLYAVERRPTGDSPDSPEAVVVLRVDSEMPGARLVPLTRRQGP